MIFVNHAFVLYIVYFEFRFFFFKQKTAYEMRISDWSSDVCSSDLRHTRTGGGPRAATNTGARSSGTLDRVHLGTARAAYPVVCRSPPCGIWPRQAQAPQDRLNRRAMP